jgi:hypothetical protein
LSSTSIASSISLQCVVVRHLYNQFFHLSFLNFSDPPSFLNFSNYLVAFLILSHHHFSTIVALFKARSSLKSISYCFHSIFQRTLPLSNAMTITLSHPTTREGVYTAISVRGIINIPSSTKKSLIHRGISLNSLSLAPFLKISSAYEKDWWFSATNSIMYPSIMVLTHKSTARVTGKSSLWSAANLSVSHAQIFLTRPCNSGSSWSLLIE